MTQFHALIAFAVLVIGLIIYILSEIATERFEEAERIRIRQESLRNQRLRYEANRIVEGG